MTSLHQLTTPLHQPGRTVRLATLRDALQALAAYRDAVVCSETLHRAEAALRLQITLNQLPRCWVSRFRKVKHHLTPAPE